MDKILSVCHMMDKVFYFREHEVHVGHLQYKHQLQMFFRVAVRHGRN